MSRSFCRRIASPREAGSIDLIETAAVHTYLSGGTVYTMEQENMPDNAAVAAVLKE